MDRAEELRLLEAVQRGDADSFAVLYHAHVQAIFRYISYRVSDAQLAEDLTADVFIKALKGIPAYVDQGKPFLAWLYRIAHARVVDYFRQVDRRPMESDIERETVATEPDMDHNIVRRQAAQTLRRVIADLTAEQQQVVILRFIEGYPIEDVANMMGKKPNAIKALQHRALRTLAGKLERSGFQLDEILEGL